MQYVYFEKDPRQCRYWCWAPKHVIVSFVSAFVTITGYHCPLSIHLSQIIYENIKERF